jgi:hypothetical protein
MNLATILIDTEADLGIVAVTNFPEQKANDAVYAAGRNRSRQHSSSSQSVSLDSGHFAQTRV